MLLLVALSWLYRGGVMNSHVIFCIPLLTYIHVCVFLSIWLHHMSSALQHTQHTLCFLTGKKRMFKLIYFCHFGQFHTSDWHYVFVRINFPHTIKNMSNKSSWIWVNILHKSLSSNQNQTKSKRNKTVCISYGVYYSCRCSCLMSQSLFHWPFYTP